MDSSCRRRVLAAPAVGEQGHRVVAHERGPDCGLHAQVRDHPADDQLADAEAAQQRLERGPLEGVEAYLVVHQVLGPAAEFVHHVGVPGAGRPAVDARQGGTVPDQRPALVDAARPVHVPGEHHGDRGPTGPGDRDGGVADGGLGALQAHADLAGTNRPGWQKPFCMSHHEQRAGWSWVHLHRRSVAIHGNCGCLRRPTADSGRPGWQRRQRTQGLRATQETPEGVGGSEGAGDSGGETGGGEATARS